MSRFLRSTATTLMLIVLASLLAACGSTVITANPTQSTESQVYSTTDAMNGTLSINAPKGLINRGDTETGLLAIGTVDSALSTSDPTPLTAGQWGLAISALPPNVATVIMSGGGAPTPKQLLDAVQKELTKTVSQVTFGTTEDVMIGSYRGARLKADSPQGDIVLLAFQLDSAYILGTGVVAKGELASHESMMTDILASATYTIK